MSAASPRKSAYVERPAWIVAALHWDSVFPGVVGIVPVADKGPGQLIPLIQWEKVGPLLAASQILEWAATHPEPAGFAITLDNFAWGGPRLGCVDDDAAKPGHPTLGLERPRPLGGYRELSKTGGTHDIFRFEAPLPPNVPARVTRIPGAVDVLCGGILFTAPTTCRAGSYRVITPLTAGIPVFPSVGAALDAAAPWLRAAWRARARGDAAAPGVTAAARPGRPAPADHTELLERIRAGSRAGQIAAYIIENTDGESRDYALCFSLATHAVAAGGTDDQVRTLVGCTHPEWDPAHGLPATIRRLRRADRPPPAGVTALLRYAEGRAAEAALTEHARAWGVSGCPRPVVLGSHVAAASRRRSRRARPVVSEAAIARYLPEEDPR